MIDTKRCRSFLDYMDEFKKEWVGMDMYDIVERGALHRSISRFVFIY